MWMENNKERVRHFFVYVATLTDLPAKSLKDCSALLKIFPAIGRVYHSLNPFLKAFSLKFPVNLP